MAISVFEANLLSNSAQNCQQTFGSDMHSIGLKISELHLALDQALTVFHKVIPK